MSFMSTLYGEFVTLSLMPMWEHLEWLHKCFNGSWDRIAVNIWRILLKSREWCVELTCPCVNHFRPPLIASHFLNWWKIIWWDDIDPINDFVWFHSITIKGVIDVYIYERSQVMSCEEGSWGYDFRCDDFRFLSNSLSIENQILDIKSREEQSKLILYCRHIKEKSFWNERLLGKNSLDLGLFFWRDEDEFKNSAIWILCIIRSIKWATSGFLRKLMAWEIHGVLWKR